MKIILLLFISISVSFSQDFDELYFGTNDALDIMTWNIEWFPKNGETTVDYVTQIFDALNIDVLAIQEVDDISSFNQVINGLENYEGYLESILSQFGGLAYIYNAQTVEINDIYEIYTTSSYWSPFPRSPMVMDMNFMGENYIIINNHFKCCGDNNLDLNDNGDEETRRYIASNLLKEYIDDNFPTNNVIVLGDLNDILTDNVDNNVFQMIIDDVENYLFTDIDIAQGNSSEWSFPNWPSHLDHILITNELFDNNSYVEVIRIDDFMDGGFSEYDQNISDHRPVALKLTTDIEEECNLTTDDIMGPYFFEGAPLRTVIAHPDEPGQRLFISGRILQNDCESPISGAMLEVWHPNDAGCYSIVEDCSTGNPANDYYNLRGKMFSDLNGQYNFETILPGYYEPRPRHIHIQITTPNEEVLVSQLYFEDDPFCESDPWCQDANDRIISLEENEFGLHGEMEFNMSSISNGIILGDINFDSLLNVQDIILLVGIIMNDFDPSDFQIYSGDMNNDEIINVQDIVQIIYIILNVNTFPQECYIIPEVGPCDGICPTYYYNQTSNECEEFITGCCGVEAFNTMQDCQNTCE